MPGKTRHHNHFIEVKSFEIVDALLNRLKTDLLQHFLSVLVFHENIGPEVTRCGLQGTAAILASGRIAFVAKFKSFYSVIAKKILYNQLGLGLAVTITFIRQCDIYIIWRAPKNFRYAAHQSLRQYCSVW